MDRIKEARKRLDDANEEHSKQWEMAMNMPSWSDFESHMQQYSEKVAIASREYRLLQVPVMTEIKGNNGDRMSLRDFICDCNDGGFIDYDGFGRYIRGFKESDINIYPSDVKHGKTRTDFAEIMWYNR